MRPEVQLPMSLGPSHREQGREWGNQEPPAWSTQLLPRGTEEIDSRGDLRTADEDAEEEAQGGTRDDELPSSGFASPIGSAKDAVGGWGQEGECRNVGRSASTYSPASHLIRCLAGGEPTNQHAKYN
jgi:hypothetical protein